MLIKFFPRAYNTLMLKTIIPRIYQVKEGQSVLEIATAFFLPVGRLIEANALRSPVRAGQLLKIPPPSGHLYTVQPSDTKEMLCGSEKKYNEKNGETLFPGKKVFL